MSARHDHRGRFVAGPQRRVAAEVGAPLLDRITRACRAEWGRMGGNATAEKYRALRLAGLRALRRELGPRQWRYHV